MATGEEDRNYWRVRALEAEQNVALAHARLRDTVQELRRVQETLERIRERNRAWREVRAG